MVEVILIIGLLGLIVKLAIEVKRQSTANGTCSAMSTSDPLDREAASLIDEYVSQMNGRTPPEALLIERTKLEKKFKANSIAREEVTKSVEMIEAR